MDRYGHATKIPLLHRRQRFGHRVNKNDGQNHSRNRWFGRVDQIARISLSRGMVVVPNRNIHPPLHCKALAFSAVFPYNMQNQKGLTAQEV